MPAKITPKMQIKSGGEVLKLVMVDNLQEIAGGMINQVAIGLDKASAGTKINAIKKISPKGVKAYEKELLEAMSALYIDAHDLAGTEVPKPKKLADWDKLPAQARKYIKAQAGLVVSKQVSDLQKSIEFSFMSNYETTDSDDQLIGDLAESADDYLSAAVTASTTTAANVVDRAREDLFFDDEVKDQIIAFEFVNEDPVTEICNDLSGTVFDKDDPDLFRFTPPLHFNCKSWIRPLVSEQAYAKALKKNDQTEPIKLKPSTKRIEEQIQFHDCKSGLKCRE